MPKDTKGITVSKEKDFSEWYTQVIQKAELIEYSPVSGCYILRPTAYAIWENVQATFDRMIKADGVKNVYFPLFIPESLLSKESSHVQGFAPEVAWVTHGGNTPLGERLAVRPTSETIMYDAFAKWIRSYNDLPLRINQWCNVVRWEFKHPVPFIRAREFLWQEGHTAFAKKEEAVVEAQRILKYYEQVFHELYALPVLLGKKSESEKFAGADFTLSVEVVLPQGKAAQGATSHHLGQNFSRAFGITFSDEKQQQQHVWQNSWGLSTRSIGLMIMVHSDDKGLVLPPAVAPLSTVIVPILFDDSKKKVLKAVEEVQKRLTAKSITTHVDNRENYSPGWKFSDWELKGVPLRIEIGPKDVEKKLVTVVRRDTGEKKTVGMKTVEKEIPKLLQQIQENLYKKAERLVKENIVTVKNIKEAEKELANKKIIFAPWCGNAKCEEQFKEKTTAKSLNSPLKQPAVKGEKCFHCGEKATSWFYWGKSY